MNTNNLTVGQLRTFCLVYRQKSFSAAAQLLGLATPSVWTQIKGMETLYGAPLFLREGRGIRATSAADSLYRSLLPILASLDKIQVDSVTEPLTVSLAIGESVVFDIAESLGKFLSTPEQASACVNVKRVPDRKVDDLMLSGEADIGIWQVTKTEFIERELSATRIGPVPCWLVHLASHPLADLPSVSLADLVRFPLIVGAGGLATRKLLEIAVRNARQNASLMVPVEVNDFNVLIDCVRAGVGVGVVAAPQSALCVHGLIARSLDAKLGQAFWAIGHRRGRRTTSSVFENLLSLLQQGGTIALAKKAVDWEPNSKTVHKRRIVISRKKGE